MVARALVGKERYKPAERGNIQAAAQDARDRIVQKLSDGSLFAKYRLSVELRASLSRVCIDDADGDSLDAVLAAPFRLLGHGCGATTPMACLKTVILLRAGSSIR